MTQKPQRRLGRGLASLISADIAAGQPAELPGDQQLSGDAHRNESQTPEPTRDRPAAQLQLIQVHKVRQNPLQPRKTFDEAALQSLAESLRRQGALQPIVVRPMGDGYELVAGERRLRAAKLAGIENIPAIVRSVADEHLLELALIENIQRADLNAVERARAYKLLQDKYNLSHEQIGERMGEDRATIANYIRLLGLPQEALELLAGGKLSMGQARALITISDTQLQLSLARKAASEQWSVRRVEQEASAQNRGRAAESPSPAKRPAAREMEQQLTAALGLRVTIKEGRKRHSGRLSIDYYSLDDFERVIRLLGVEPELA